MYQEEVKPNPAILKKYILADKNASEWLVQMYECPSYYYNYIEVPNYPDHVVFAVYKPTGRVFRKFEMDKPFWEYEYEGVRIL